MRKLACALGVALLAACETASVVEAPAAIAMMDEATFSSAMDAADATRNPFQEVARLERLLAMPNLTDDQRARTIFIIAINQGTVIPNRTAAVASYNKVISLLPPDHSLAVRSIENRDYALTQLGYMQKRVDNGTGSFEDALNVGSWDEVIERAKSRKITVTRMEAEKMYYAGRFCEVQYGHWRIGADNIVQKQVGVCETPRDPIDIDPLEFR